MWSRPGKDWVERFTRIAGALRRLPAESFVLDGEAVLLRDDGRNDFLAMRGRMEDAVLMAFDLLEIDGVDLRGEPIEARRAVLAELVAEERRGLLFSRSLDDDGATVFRHACALGLEGIVSKRRGSKYRSGPTSDWRKCRCEGYVR